MTGRQLMGRGHLAITVAAVVLVTLVSAPGPVRGASPTPLEASGLTPTWREDFVGGSIQTLQYSWANGSYGALRSYVQPGAAFLAQDGSTSSDWVEQQLNHFKGSATEPMPRTIEFDVFSPHTGSGRVSLRPRRRGDMAHIKLGLPKDRTNVSVRFVDTAETINYSQRTGPSHGWAHVIASYRQFVVGSTTHAHYVIAVNGEVHEWTGVSGITNPDFATYWQSSTQAEGWSIEHRGNVNPMGKYIANVRGYAQFLSVGDMQGRLAGAASYAASLPDPRGYSGPTKSFSGTSPLDLYGPNPVVHTRSTGALSVEFDGSLSSAWRKITQYSWSFGDGTTGTGRVVRHAYTSPGTYRARLVLTSTDGTRELTFNVAVNAP